MLMLSKSSNKIVPFQQIRQTVLTRVESRVQSITTSQLVQTPEAEDNSEVIFSLEKKYMFLRFFFCLLLITLFGI